MSAFSKFPVSSKCRARNPKNSGSPSNQLISCFRPSEPIQHPQTKMDEVRHAEGPPQDVPQAMIEALGAAVAGPVDKVVGNLVQPILQRPAEGIQPLQSG